MLLRNARSDGSPVVLERLHEDPGEVGLPPPGHGGLAHDLGEGRVLAQSDQETAGALQPAEVPAVGRRDPGHAHEVGLGTAALLLYLLRQLEQLVEVLEEDHVVRAGEDVAVLQKRTREAGLAAAQAGPVAGLAYGQLLLGRRVR